MFDAVVGHARARRLLEAAVRGRPSHAYLIVGPEAVGKRELARAFAAALNCAAPVDARSCGRCQSCRLLAAGAHPDFREVDRTTGAEERRGRAQQKFIPIEVVRALQHDAALTAHLGGYKVYVIAGADDLSVGAMDALLKTLEEPAPGVVIVMTATDVGLLPPTVVSRCQLVKLGLVPSEEIAAALVERKGLDPERADLIAHLAVGRPGRAFELAEDDKVLAEAREQLAGIAALDVAGRIDRLKAGERLAQAHGRSPEATERWLELLLLWWRDVLLVRTGCEEMVVNRERLPELRARAGRLSVRQAGAALRAIEQTSLYLAENVQPRLALELLLLSLPRAA